jgi:hypothetical protein
MTGLLHLPPELLPSIVDLVAFDETPETEIVDETFNHDCHNKYHAITNPSASPLSRQQVMFASMRRPDILSLRNLRLVSRHFSQACASHPYNCVRLLPREESATNYNRILSTLTLSEKVRKVVFQTRMVPGGSTSYRSHQEPGLDDDYCEPHSFFTDAMEEVGRFPDLTHVEIVFASPCCAPQGDNWVVEDDEFRETVMRAFYAGLNHHEHPAIKVSDLSIKNLQDYTPQALISSSKDEDITFRKDFEQVMSRVTRLSLQIATEDNRHAPEHTLDIPESHNFFGDELQEYWIAPIAKNLVYLKLYANEMLFGLFPTCNLPRLPKIRTLLLGNLSIGNDDQIDWILGHAATLQKLVLDGAVIAVAADFFFEVVDIDHRRVVYSPLKIEHGRASYQPNRDGRVACQKWRCSTRWHHLFSRLQHGLPNLKHFTMGRGNWDAMMAFDEAETLTNMLVDARYQYLDRGTGPDDWLCAEGDDKVYNDWEEIEEDIVYQPECDEEDWKVLNEFLDELKRRR